jgi:hypothetical protein
MSENFHGTDESWGEKGDCGMTRKVLALTASVVACAAALAVAPLASADPPIHVVLEAPPDVSGQYCEDFMVGIHVTRFREVATIFSNGEVLTTGALAAEVTNLESGRTIEVNIPGPGRVSVDGSTVTATGPWLLFGEEGDLGEGSPAQVTYLVGRFTFTVEQGQITHVSEVRGHTRDLCAELAL